MTGVVDSVIGVKKELVVQKCLDSLPVRFEPAEGKAVLCAVCVEVKRKKAVSIERIRLSK